MENLLEEALKAGFDIIRDQNLEINPSASRLLPPESKIIGYDVAGDVLAAVSNYFPSPAELRQFEKESGMNITLSIAEPEVFEAIRLQQSKTSDSSGVPLSIGPLLQLAVENGASDVHLAVGQHPILRTEGQLVPVDDFGLLSTSDLEAAAKWIAGEKYEGFNGDFDCAITYANSRWRVNLYSQRQSLALAIRRIPSEVPRLETLGLPESVLKIAAARQGLVLFCGPTGSGKSTSLAALIDRINSTRQEHILTIEDPVEYVHRSKKSMIHQREVGDDTASFATGLRSSLRQDPDIILVGELRDPVTMEMALTAAETGHLVFATVHSATAEEAFTRIIGSFPALQRDQVRTQLAASVHTIVAQQLLQGEEGKRVLATEVLVNTLAIRNLLQDNKVHQIAATMETSRAEGMHTFDMTLAALTAAKIISLDTAMRYVREKTNFKTHLDTENKKATNVAAPSFADSWGDNL